MTTKNWYESRGVWGAVTTIVVAVLALVGYTVDADSHAQLTDLLLAVGGGIGGIVALWGRIAARQRIGRRSNGELGYIHFSALALLAVVSMALYGCAGTALEVRKADIPVSQELSPQAQAVQKMINEANVALTAVKRLIGDKVASGEITPDEAQKYLDDTRDMDRAVDAAQSALDIGDPTSAQAQAELLNKLINALDRELAKRALEDGDGK